MTSTFAAHIAGPVWRPGETGYADEVAGFNLATTHTPDFAVGATSADDVVAAVNWAREQRLPIAVQATGHGANVAVEHGVLINTRRLNQVTIDPDERTATVAAGATWRDVLAAAAPHGLAGLSGSASGVGVVGYTLGGGLPLLGRAFGYASDWVRAFEVVTPDGVVRAVDADREPDLFWALRGGKGNVGVVTSLVCGLLPITRIYGGSVFYSGVHAATVLRAYAGWVDTLPEATCTAVQLLRLPPLPDIPAPLRGQFMVQLCVAHVGDPDEGARLLAPMRAAAAPAIDTVAEMDYAQCDQIFQDPAHPVPAQEAGLLLRELSDPVVNAVLELAGPDSECPLLLVGLRHLGGALSRPPAVEDAVCARDARFALQTVGVLAGPHAGEIATATAAAQAALSPYSTGRTLVNLHGRPGDEADRARPWTPDAYARLTRIKQRHDPNNLLRFGHAVAPGAGRTACV